MLYGKVFAQCAKTVKSINLSAAMVNDACLAYVREGHQELFTPTQKIDVRDSESVLMKCGNYINKIRQASATSPYKSMIFHLDPESIKQAFVGKNLDFLNVKPSTNSENPALKLNRNLQLDSFVNSMFLYFKNPELATEKLLTLKLQELVYILSGSGANTEAIRILGTLYIPEKAAFEEIVKANVFNNLNVQELAHLCARSESTFKRDFRKWYHQSPAKYIKQKRLERAAELLKKTNQPINTIAWDCGFESAAHFSTSFLSFFKVSPRVYRMTQIEK